MGQMIGYEPPPADPMDMLVPPNFQMVDTHIHWWDHNRTSVKWGVSNKAWQHPRLMGAWRLNQAQYFVPQYKIEAAGLGVVKTVHVQCATPATPSVAETEWLQEVADKYGWPNGIIARSTLVDANCTRELDENSKYGNFRGVRDWSPHDQIGSDLWERGYRALLQSNGVCELMIDLDSFDRMYEVAKRHPDHTIILCHAGLPVTSRLDEYQEKWRVGIRKLAQAPNIVVKISALSSAAPANFYFEVVREWIGHCVESFGPSRCMFGSNFHIERLFVTLPRLFRMYRRALAGYSDAEQQQVFLKTAERVYRV